ncbi:hypothetical protein C8J56DRAFT_848328 [Mycena floridula]|nr:hypothetical protein C8J56DRAFT_848328 [Mycena floridula]
MTTTDRWHFELHPTVEKGISHKAFQHGFFHPTHMALSQQDGDNLNWTSRDHRKGRHLARSPHSGQARKSPTMIQRIGHMTRIEYWNISWWVAMAFTWGSVVWVVNGFIVFLPFCNSHVPEMLDAGGWTAWVGATIFEFGSVFGMWEAWNRDDTVNFGWGVEKALYPDSEAAVDTPPVSEKEPTVPTRRQWKWFSTDRKYWHEFGFLAAFAQLCAASIFWIAG